MSRQAENILTMCAASTVVVGPVRHHQENVVTSNEVHGYTSAPVEYQTNYKVFCSLAESHEGQHFGVRSSVDQGPENFTWS